MNTLTIKPTTDFTSLNISAEKIIGSLVDLDFIIGHTDEAGKTVGDVLKENALKTSEFCFMMGLDESSETIAKMEGLTLFNDLYDCPNCGHETQDNYDGYGTKRCTHCDFEQSNDDDIDSMKGGYDFEWDYKNN